MNMLNPNSPKNKKAAEAAEAEAPEHFKIDGENFDCVKLLAENYAGIMKENKEREIAANEALFDGIAEALGITRKEVEGYTLNRSYEKVGIYIVERNDCDCDMPAPLKAILGALKKRAA